MRKKMTKADKKVKKVMKEFKKGELNIGKSSKKVKSRKQAIAIALSEAGKSKKRGKNEKNTSKKSVKVEHKMPVDVEMTKPNESQKEMVKGQGKILTEKKRSATWY